MLNLLNLVNLLNLLDLITPSTRPVLHVRVRVVRALGLVLSLRLPPPIVRVYVRQPATLPEVAGSLTSSVGAYRIDSGPVRRWLGILPQGPFVEARDAFAQADPARQDASVQFYIAYAYLRQGWGRVYADDALYKAGQATLAHARSLTPDNSITVNDPGLRLHTAEEVAAEFERGLTRELSDSEPDPRVSGAAVSQPLLPPPVQTRDAPGREAFTLPLLLLTVTAFGGVRVAQAGSLALVPPSLMSIILATVLVGVLVRSGALVPSRLVNDHRTPLENTPASSCLVALLAATAQVFTLVTPATGLLAFVFTTFFVLLLWNTLAAEPDRRQLLRSLLVVFGGAFVLKFVVLAALYEPQGGLLRRVMLTCSRASRWARSASCLMEPRRATSRLSR